MARIEALFARTRRARADLERVALLTDALKTAVNNAAMTGTLTDDWRARNRPCNWNVVQEKILRKRRSAYFTTRRGSRLGEAPNFCWVGENADLPLTWASGCIADVADLRLGYAFKSEWFGKSGPRLLRGANIAPGQLDWSDEKRLDGEKAADFADYRLRSGDIVVAMDRPVISTGLKIARVLPEDDGSLLVQRVASPIPGELVEPDFLWHVLHSAAFAEQIERQATGSDLPHISGNDILTTAMPLPPLPEQREIARRLDAALGQLKPMKREATRALALLDHLEQSILARAFRGELVPQDQTEEPAAAILARQHATRTTTPRRRTRAPP